MDIGFYNSHNETLAEASTHLWVITDHNTLKFHHRRLEYCAAISSPLGSPETVQYQKKKVPLLYVTPTTFALKQHIFKETFNLTSTLLHLQQNNRTIGTRTENQSWKAY